MSRTAFCTVCARTVYLGPGDEAMCPVCSSPLAEMDPPKDDLARRVAQNESAFRSLNENLNEDASEGDARDEAVYLCECRQRDCEEKVRLSPADYESMRKHPARFIIVPRHEHPDFEIVVDRHDDYLVVEKTGSTRDVAKKLDPRSDQA